jgi:hypothetical protein
MAQITSKYTINDSPPGGEHVRTIHAPTNPAAKAHGTSSLGDG